MVEPGKPQEYILMPRRRRDGLRARTFSRTEDFLRHFSEVRSTGAARSITVGEMVEVLSPVPRPLPKDLPVLGELVRVIDSVHEDGPKLVEVSPEAAQSLRDSQGDVDLEPVYFYKPCAPPVLRPCTAPKGTALRLTVVCAQTGAAIAKAEVIAFTDVANSTGAAAVTDAAGQVSLPLGGGGWGVERLHILPPPSGHWGLHRTNFGLSDGDTLGLDPVNAASADGLDFYHHRAASFNDGAGVRVAVIDSGIGPHPDLTVSPSGTNTVRGEPRTDVADNGSGHGTHVAGIIASRGAAPTGVAGLAPGVELFGWRIFDKKNGPASSYSIIKAIIYALDEGCDIINLSVGLDHAKVVIDRALMDAIEDAVEQGAVVVAAAGNDWQEPALFPARMRNVVGVSAVGRIGTFPADAYQAFEISTERGSDANDFLAAFSNVGTSDRNSEIDLMAAGVGILSTTPHGGLTPMSGTSMACAAVSGMAARLLFSDASLLGMSRDAYRSQQIRKKLMAQVRSLGFRYRYEGSGLIV